MRSICSLLPLVVCICFASPLASEGQVVSPTNETGGNPAIFSKTQKVRWFPQGGGNILIFVLPDGEESRRPIALMRVNQGEYEWDTRFVQPVSARRREPMPDSASCVLEVVQGSGPPARSDVFVVDQC